jgi:hypothetical protein
MLCLVVCNGALSCLDPTFGGALHAPSMQSHWCHALQRLHHVQQFTIQVPSVRDLFSSCSQLHHLILTHYLCLCTHLIPPAGDLPARLPCAQRPGAQLLAVGHAAARPHHNRLARQCDAAAPCTVQWSAAQDGVGAVQVRCGRVS